MKFGMSAVTASVKRSAITDEAVIIANSTRAKFTLSSLVTRQLGLLPGDNVQFVSNIEAIQIAIAEGAILASFKDLKELRQYFPYGNYRPLNN